jgi:valyl-tRNA synthetase
MAACEAVSSVNIYVPLAKLIDVGKTKDKLNQRRQALEKEMAKVNQIIGNADFKSKAPPEKVATIENQKAELTKQIASIDAQLAVLEKA